MLGSILSLAELMSSVGTARSRSVASGRLPERIKLDRKLAAAAGSNTLCGTACDMHLFTVGQLLPGSYAQQLCSME